MAEIDRREFLKVTGASLVGSSLAMMGFSPEALAEVREYKLAAPPRPAIPAPTARSPAAF